MTTANLKISLIVEVEPLLEDFRKIDGFEEMSAEDMLGLLGVYFPQLCEEQLSDGPKHMEFSKLQKIYRRMMATKE